MRWRESDGVSWLEADLPGAVAASRPASAAPARGRSRASTSAFSPATTVTPCSRTGACSTGARARPGPGRDRRARSTAPRSLVHERPAGAAAWLEPVPDPPRVDGHVSAAPGLAPLVFVADCLPIALAGPGGVAMLHGGWRGLAAGIIGAGRPRSAAPRPRSGPGSAPAATRSATRCSRRSRRWATGSRRAGCSTWRRSPRRLLERAGVGEIEAAGLCTALQPASCSSPTAATAARTGRQAGIVRRLA